jgi:hypothetical protein
MATALDPSEQRFGSFFRREIVPHIASLEAERQQRRSRLIRTAGGFAIAVPTIAWTLWPLSPAWALAAGAVLTAIGIMLARRQQQRFRERLRKLVMPAVCNAIGDIEHTSGHAPGVPFDELESLGLLPRHHQRRIDDVFSGRHRDTGFVMAEAHLLRRGSKNRRRTVLRGHVLAIDVPREIPQKF